MSFRRYAFVCRFSKRVHSFTFSCLSVSLSLPAFPSRLGTGLVTLGSPHFAGPMDMVSWLYFLETVNLLSVRVLAVC